MTLKKGIINMLESTKNVALICSPIETICGEVASYVVGQTLVAAQFKLYNKEIIIPMKIAGMK